MTAPRVAQATPRGRQWAREGRPSRLWLAVKVVAGVAFFVSLGLERIG